MRLHKFCMVRAYLVIISLLTLTACEISSSDTAMPTGPDAVWDLVIIGDSSMWRLGKAFAAQIEADVGVKVELHDLANRYGSAVTVLNALGVNGTEGDGILPGVLKNAEVVVMFVSPMDSIDPQNPHDLEKCFLFQAPELCPEDAFAQYITDLEAIWAEIFKLRDGQPIILRATDIYNPIVRPWTLKKVMEPCTACWENMNNAAKKAAEAYDIPFLSRYDAFNGATHLEDPREKGLIDDDGEHPTDLMGQESAAMLSEMGYDPVKAP